MNSESPMYHSDVQQNIRLPSENLVRCFPAVAPIAALEAAIATTKMLIQYDNPSMQELMDMIEEGESVPAHLFIAHNIIDNLDQLRITIQAYYQQVNTRMVQIRNDDLPF